MVNMEIFCLFSFLDGMYVTYHWHLLDELLQAGVCLPLTWHFNELSYDSNERGMFEDSLHPKNNYIFVSISEKVNNTEHMLSYSILHKAVFLTVDNSLKKQKNNNTAMWNAQPTLREVAELMTFSHQS